MSPRARRQTNSNTNTNTATLAAPPPNDNILTGSPTSPESRLDRISQRAYALYERRGGQDGSAEDDWFQAEREIDSED